jgi:hypothetical protein
LDTERIKEKSHKPLRFMALRVRPEGFEPPTLGSEGQPVPFLQPVAVVLFIAFTPLAA